MANVKISDLTKQTSGANGDTFEMVRSGVSYSIDAEDILPSNAVTTPRILDGAVTTGKLAALSVTEAKIANASVTEIKLGTASVTSDKLGTASVTSNKIADLNVTSAKLGTGSVTEGKLFALSVTNTKLGSGSVTYDKLNASIVDDATLELTTDIHVKDGGIDTTQLADGAVTGAKIDSGYGLMQVVEVDFDPHNGLHTFNLFSTSSLTGIVIHKAMVYYPGDWNNGLSSAFVTVGTTNYQIADTAYSAEKIVSKSINFDNGESSSINTVIRFQTYDTSTTGSTGRFKMWYSIIELP